MRLLPIRRPHLGLAFSSKRVTLVELAGRGLRAWGRPRVRRVHEQAIPAGLILPTEAAANITDRSLLVKELGGLLAAHRGRTVAMSLPDQAARIAVFDLDALPREAGERDALLRWRLQQELVGPRPDLEILSRTFRRPRTNASSGRIRHGGTIALVVGVRREVVAQYEQVCEELGLLPVSIGLSSLDLFDLCRGLLPRSGEVVFAHQSADGFTCLAGRDGAPTFVRVTNRPSKGDSLSRELLGTLQYIHDLPGADLEETRPDPAVWVVDTTCESTTDTESPAEYPGEPWSSGQLEVGGRSLSVKEVGWRELARGHASREAWPASGLPALAGIVAA